MASSAENTNCCAGKCDGKLPEIGSQPVEILSRSLSGDGSTPEFLSATILPGFAMNVLQVTAHIPGKGETELFWAPPLAEAKELLDGPGNPTGEKSFAVGGAFLIPFANRVVGELSADKQSTTLEWNGQKKTLRANNCGGQPGATPHALHGLLFRAKTDDIKIVDTPNGQTITGQIDCPDWEKQWFSANRINFTIALEKDQLVVDVEVTNTGTASEPMAIGWHPYFAIPSGDRTQARLHIPGKIRAALNNYDDVFPTGEMQSVTGTEYDFTAKDGKALSSTYLDDNWSDLEWQDGRSFAAITDPAAKYGIRLVALTRMINCFQSYSPLDKPFVAIEPQFNFNDPFAKGAKNNQGGLVTLDPGQSVRWKVALELFTPEA